MSRTVLAALRKHRTPADFAQKFLLRAMRAGKVPAIRNSPPGIAFGPPRRTGLPIIFENEKNPSQRFYFNMKQAENNRDGGSLELFWETIGPRISHLDWEEGKKIAGILTDGKRLLNLGPEHFHPDWKPKVTYFNGKPRLVFQLPEHLFGKIKKHAETGQVVKELLLGIQFLSGEISVEQFDQRIAPRRFGSNSGKKLLMALAKGHGALYSVLLRSPNEEVTTKVIKKFSPELSTSYARMLAREIEEIKRTPAYRAAVQELVQTLPHALGNSH